MTLPPGLPAAPEGAASGPVSLRELRPVLDWMQERTGLVFPRARRTHALRALRRLVRQQKLDPATLATRARHDPELLDALCNALTVSESYFFRIPEQFDAIEAHVLDALPPTDPFRCWSAGCSEGQEIYSLAMLLDDRGLLSRSELWATDLSPQALDVARRARYRPWALRGRACQPLRALLTDETASFEVAEHLRRAVRFEHDNLVTDAPAPGPGAGPGFDLILCRHVLIYLDADAVAGVARRLFNALRPGGWLICAPADPLLFEHAPFEAQSAPGGLLYRRPQQVHAPPPRHAFSSSAPALSHPSPALTTELPTSAPPADPVPAPPEDAPLPRAQRAFDARDWSATVALLSPLNLDDDPQAALLHLRALANLDVERALASARRDHALLSHHPHYHYLLARLALASGDESGALNAARRALYLQPDFLMAHHLQAQIWIQLANPERARISLLNLLQRGEALPADHLVELGEGRRLCDLLSEVRTAWLNLSSQGGDDVER